MRPGQSALTSAILEIAEDTYREEHGRLLEWWKSREEKISEACSILWNRPDLMRLARRIAGCNVHDAVPVRVAGIDEKSPKKPVMRGKYYHKYSWKHPAGFRMTEYEPSTRYVCVSVRWIMRHM